MDNVTHSLFALTLARTRLRPDGPGGAATTTALVLASNAPDIDIVAAFSSGEGAYLAAHRGVTHGPIGALALAFVCAAIATFLTRRTSSDGSRSGFARLVMVALAGVVFHVMMDLPTPYGTRLLSPFSGRWFAFDWMPIIDVYLLILLGGSLAAGRVWVRRRGTVAAAALTLMIVNYAIHATGHASAIRKNNGTRPWDLQSWNGEPAAPCGEGPCDSLAAMPTFVSPFAWRIVKPVHGGYELMTTDVFRGAAGSPQFIANTVDPWTERARSSALGGVFYGFSRFPAAASRNTADGGAVVSIVDLRYTSAPPGSDVRSAFVVRIELDRTGGVRAERLGR